MEKPILAVVKNPYLISKPYSKHYHQKIKKANNRLTRRLGYLVR
jgi:hypothetical protein